MAEFHLPTLIRHHPRHARMRSRSPRVVPGVRPSLAREIEYRHALASVVDECRRAGRAVVDEVRSPWRAANDAVAAQAGGRFEEALRRAAARFGNIEATAKRLAWASAYREFEDVDDRLAKVLLQSVSVDIRPLLTHDKKTTAAMGRAITENVDLIKSIPAKYLGQVRDLVSRSFPDGARWETLVDGIVHIGDVTESRARLIARDQTGKMNADFNRVRQTSIGIEAYRWRGVGDVRERASHVNMEGQRVLWSAPPAVDGEHVHAGEAIQCRCWGDPEVEVDAVEERQAA